MVKKTVVYPINEKMGKANQPYTNHIEEANRNHQALPIVELPHVPAQINTIPFSFKYLNNQSETKKEAGENVTN